MEFIIFIGIISIIALIVWEKFFSKTDTNKQENLISENQTLKENINKLTLENSQKNEKIGEISSKLEKEQSEKNELQGKNKQMFVNITNLQEKNSNLQSQLDEYKKKLTKIESKQEQEQKEFTKKVEELNQARKVLLDEKQRIRQEDEERLKQKEAERDRIWAEHENNCLSKMKEICQKPEINFDFFENKDLPENFDGTLKPDFLVSFLEQYIIFDAKMSKSSNLNNYLNEQVKSTVKKIKSSKNKDEIYPQIFFIIPTLEFQNLKKISFFEEGFSFFVIPLESFESIISAYKKITHYELAEHFDPKERENIVNLIAAYDQHISRQNSVNILSSMEGIKVMQMKEKLNNSLQEEVIIKKKKIRTENFKPSDLKRLIQNTDEQLSEMKKLTTNKKPEIKKEDVQEVEQIGLFE